MVVCCPWQRPTHHRGCWCDSVLSPSVPGPLQAKARPSLCVTGARRRISSVLVERLSKSVARFLRSDPLGGVARQRGCEEAEGASDVVCELVHPVILPKVKAPAERPIQSCGVGALVQQRLLDRRPPLPG